MPRAFTSADIVQADGGTASSVANPPVTLPSGTVEGNCGIIVIGGFSSIDSPEHWHIAARTGVNVVNPIMAVLCRADLPAGETSWPFEAVGASATWWVWSVMEWTNVSFAPLLTAANTLQSTGPSSISSGTTGAWDPAEYALGIAATWNVADSTSPTAWPSAVSWSNGFTEIDVRSLGDGTANTNLQLRVAAKYGAAGDAGAWETTATMAGAQTGNGISACVAVFRAEHFVGEA